MSIDTKTAGRVAKLARIKVEEADLPRVRRFLCRSTSVILHYFSCFSAY